MGISHLVVKTKSNAGFDLKITDGEESNVGSDLRIKERSKAGAAAVRPRVQFGKDSL